MATPEKCLFVFTSRLGCKKDLDDTDIPDVSNKLPCFLDDESSRCTFPSLGLDKCSCAKTSEQAAVDELNSKLEVRKETISAVPTALLRNISRSFGAMIDSRINQVHLLLVASSAEKNKDSSTDLEASSLLCSRKSSPSSFTSAETSFRPLPLSKGFIKSLGRLKVVILPIVFKAIVHVNILGKVDHKVTITAPGTIIGNFLGTCNRLRSAEVTIDTSALYQCMKTRCDQVVQQAFEVAAFLSSIQTPSSSHDESKREDSKGQSSRKSPVGSRSTVIPISP